MQALLYSPVSPRLRLLLAQVRASTLGGVIVAIVVKCLMAVAATALPVDYKFSPQ